MKKVICDQLSTRRYIDAMIAQSPGSLSIIWYYASAVSDHLTGCFHATPKLHI
jgi:hypothetical protein